jgi:hypothetical protein
MSKCGSQWEGSSLTGDFVVVRLPAFEANAEFYPWGAVPLPETPGRREDRDEVKIDD